MKLLLFVFITLSSYAVTAQTGPGGVFTTDGTSALQIWLDATDLDADGITEGLAEGVVAGTVVNAWNNKSGDAGRNLDVGTAPDYIAAHAGLNNMPAVSFVAASSHYLTSTNTVQLSPSGNITVYLVTDDHGFCESCPAFNWRTAANVGGITIEGLSTLYHTFSYDAAWSSITSTGYNTTDSYIFSTQVSATGSNQYSNGTLMSTGAGSSVNNVTAIYGLARNIATTTIHLDMKMSETIVYDGTINSAQKIIVDNYLSAKYNIALAANDLYDEDDAANGDYDFEVAGIGQVDVTNLHNDAQGPAMVRILNPSDLDNDEFMIWGHDNAAAMVTGFADVPAALDARIDRVWRASEVNSAGTAIDVGSVDVRWDLNGLGPIVTTDLRLLVDTDNDGVFADEVGIAGATDLGGGVYQFAGVTAITNNLRFTLATVNWSITPLPVELSDFRAIPNRNGEVDLTWTTLSETNNNFFTLEKSENGTDWEMLSVIDGAGNSSVSISYYELDRNPFQGVSYYRLKLTDFNGNESFSEIRSVEFNRFEIVQTYPNPSSGKIYLTVNSPLTSDGNVQIYSSFGQVIMNESILIKEGANDYSLFPPQQAKGLYILKVYTDDGKYSDEIQIQFN